MSTRRARILIIDPQNDFCDIPGAALPVPGGDADMKRLAGFLAKAGEAIEDLVVTLDSHASTPSSPEITWSLALLMVGLAHLCTGAHHT